MNRELHRGGQGVVYLAEQQSPHRQVAIKMVREGPLASRGERQRFHREIEALGSLSHPNIVSIHDTGEEAGHLYFVMDYVDGPSLDEFVRPRRERALSSRTRKEYRHFLLESLRMFLKVCDAVQAAHLRGIIHRDLKPSNIRVGHCGEPRVLDFGLAKTTAVGDSKNNAQSITQAGQFLGTLAFASPEQAEGASEDLDVRSDVYSLGVILYQLLTGQQPYEVSGKLSDVLNAIQHQAPRPPSSQVPDLRGDPEIILLTCLQKQPDRRYQTAGALADDIRQYLNGEPIDARRDSPGYVLRKQLAKHRLPVAAASVIFVLIVVSLAISVSLWQTASRQGRQALLEAQKANAISDFLQKMLASASPYQRPGKPTQVQEVLQDAERRLAAGAFRDQPDVEASLRNTLGMSYLALGRSEDAISQLTTALQLREAILPANDLHLAECHHNLGRAYLDHSDYTSAEEHLEQALRLFSTNPASTVAERVADTEYRLAMITKNRGHVAAAGERFSRALALLGESGDARPRAQCTEGLSVVRSSAGDFASAVDLARQAVSIQRAAYGDHPYLISSLNQLGTATLANQDYSESLEAHREATELCRKFLRHHPELAYTLNLQGQSLFYLGRYEDALACFVEGQSILSEYFNAEDVRIQSLKGMSARALWRLGKIDEASAIDRELIETNRRLGRRMGLSTGLINYAESLRVARRFDEAEAGLREAVDILRTMKSEGLRVPNLASAVRNLGNVVLEQGRYADAETLVRKSLDLFAEMTQPRGTFLADAKGLLADCLLARGAFAEAEDLLLQSMEDLERFPSPPLDVNSIRQKTVERLISLHGAWNAAEPHAGHDVQQAEWNEKLAALQNPVTQPAHTP